MGSRNFPTALLSHSLPISFLMLSFPTFPEERKREMRKQERGSSFSGKAGKGGPREGNWARRNPLVRWKDNKPSVNKRKEDRKFSWEFRERVHSPGTAPRHLRKWEDPRLSSKP
ncbi:hypothetical protein NPIL_183261 [Nephila pilipes]|uniref:Uncharacterized protein n=1 Tax=Nephila pilipes TaxID=299642 RepID=A0A8X6TCM5_NEPPI|nr:hypothetical protein NPIL_183261 [Nephila pilipes]